MSFLFFSLWVLLGCAVAVVLARLTYRQLHRHLPRKKLRCLQPYTPHQSAAAAPAQEDNPCA